MRPGLTDGAGTFGQRLLERLGASPRVAGAHRVSWSQTYVRFYLVPKLSLIVVGGAGMFFVANPAGRHPWANVGIGIFFVALAVVCWRRNESSLWDVWVRGDTLVLTRYQLSVEVPLAAVTSIEVASRSAKAPIMVMKWIDGPGVSRMIRFAAPESPTWRSLRDRLSVRVPPVHFY